MQNDILKKSLAEASELYNLLQQNELLCDVVLKAKDAIVTAFSEGNAVYLCGNGGSAADAQHLAAEFSGRYKLERKALPCEALQVNSSFVTAVSNDYHFDHIFERGVEAFCREGDILIALSTSGNSVNIINGIKKARLQNVLTIGMTGLSGGSMNDICDLLIKIPSSNTPRIQEAHLFVGHIICEMVEKELFSDEK